MMKILKNNEYILPVTIFALAYLIASIIPNLISYFVTYPTTSSYYLEGKAERKIVSDKATMNITTDYNNKDEVINYIKKDNPTLSAMYSLRLSGDTANIIIESNNVYDVENQCSSIMRDADKIDAKCDVKYTYSNINNLKDQMMTEAAMNARKQADSIAMIGKVKIDELTSVDTTSYDSFTVMPVISNEAECSDGSTNCDSYNYNSGYASPYDDTSIEKIVTAKVKATFSVK